jgi:hypothetical protein
MQLPRAILIGSIIVRGPLTQLVIRAKPGRRVESLQGTISTPSAAAISECVYEEGVVADGGGSRNSPQYRHFLASTRIFSAQNGQRFVASGAATGREAI